MARPRSERTLRRYDLYGWPQKGEGADPADYPEVEAWPARMQLRIGTSGWAYPHWRGRVYPDTASAPQHLAFLSRRLPTIEVNSTYYRLPRPETFDAWADATPPGFRFTIKAPGIITHEKRLVETDADVAAFLDAAGRLGEKLGTILWQFPPGFHADVRLLERFLDGLPRDVRHAVELRHRSWFERDVYWMLAEREVAFVVHDYNRKGTPLVETAPFVYLRLHGPTGRYRGSYPVETLFAWAEQVNDWLARGFKVLVYFNNDERGKSIENLATLRELLAR